MYYRKLNSNLREKNAKLLQFMICRLWIAMLVGIWLKTCEWDTKKESMCIVIILLKCNESPPVCTVLYKIFHLLPTVCGYRYQYHGIITNTVTQQDLDLFVLNFCDIM